MLFLLQPAAGASASPNRVEWKELRTEHFAIIYPADYETLAQLMLASYGQTLDQEYERFSAIFAYELNTPVSIRVYQTIPEFQTLNPLTPAVDQQVTHSHIGYREIALIGANIMADPKWSSSAVNHIRYELAILFAEQLADLKAPPGLLAGMGRYAQDPQLGDEIRAGIQAAGTDVPVASWRAILEDKNAFIRPFTQIATTSIVSFLVDQYGWSKFLEFLKATATSDNYLEALFTTYPIKEDELQPAWLVYYPSYLSNRWEISIFYQYDLSPFEKLIAAGAFADASQELSKVIELLQATRQTDRLEQAQALLEKSRTGQQATEKALQARQAVISGDYDLAILRAGEAYDLFSAIGDQRRLEELDRYTARAEEALALRAEVESIGARVLLQANPLQDIPRLLKIGERMSALQDAQGVARVNQVLESARNQQESRRNILRIAGAALLAILLGLRFWLAFRPVPVEVVLR